MAVNCNNVAILKEVLDHNPDKSALYNGDTALHYAIRHNKGKQVLYLIGYDYPINSLNRNQDTPISLAQKLKNQHILSVIENPVQLQKASDLKHLSSRSSLKVTLFKDLPFDQQPESMKRMKQQQEEQIRLLRTSFNAPDEENQNVVQSESQPQSGPIEPSIPQQSLNLPSQSLEQSNPVNLPNQPPMFPSVVCPPNQNNLPYQYPQPQPFIQPPNQELVQRTDFSQLQKRVVIMEQILSQILPKYNNQSLFQPKICFSCNSKPGLNICPVCSNSFCQEDFYAHVAHGCKNLQ